MNYSGSIRTDGRRTAFVLNANAKSVNYRVIRRFKRVIPKRDLFLSQSFQHSEDILREICRRGYDHVFSGGGDGTFVNLINNLKQVAKKDGIISVPSVGILRLGTGNAIASAVDAHNPGVDVRHIMMGGTVSTKPISMVECACGTATPFASVGLDSEILNDYYHVKAKHLASPFKPIIHSVFGYFVAGFGRTFPRRLWSTKPHYRVVTNKPCKRISFHKGERFIEHFAAGETIFDGSALAISAGSIPYYGGGIKMFPFAGEEEGKVQLRIAAMGLRSILTNLYPGIWKGTYSHPLLFDFLIEDVTIISNERAPYQIGGDAMGYEREVRFKATDVPVSMAHIEGERIGQGIRGRVKQLAAAFN